MNKLLQNKLFAGLLIGSVFLIFPLISHAQSASGESAFGGMEILHWGAAVCDCGGNTTYVLDYKTNNVLSLYEQSGQSIFYSYYNTSGTYQLGTYSNGGEYCSILVYSECVDITNNYTYGNQPGTGTTLTDASGSILSPRGKKFFATSFFKPQDYSTKKLFSTAVFLKFKKTQ